MGKMQRYLIFNCVVPTITTMLYNLIYHLLSTQLFADTSAFDYSESLKIDFNLLLSFHLTLLKQ